MVNTSAPVSATAWLDQLPIWICRLDALSRCHFVNRSLLLSTGTAASDWISQPLSKLPLTAETRQHWEKCLDDVITNGGVRQITYPLTQFNGNLIWVEARFVAESARQQNIGACVTIMDVTARVERETTLRHSEQRLQGFLRMNTAVAWIKDDEGKYSFASKAFEQQFGLTEFQWLGRTDFDLPVPQDFAQACQEADRAVLDSGEAKVAQGTVQGIDEQVREWQLLRFPYRDEDGNAYLGGIATDLTEVRRLQRALVESEERLKGLMDNSPVVAWMKDNMGRYVYLSRTFESRFNVKLRDWRGKTDHDFNDRADAIRFEESDHAVMRTGERSEATETTWIKGEQRHWWVMKYPVQTPRGERFIGGVAVDITERKMREDRTRLESLTDPLTGVYNRRGFELLCEQEYKRHRREADPLVLFIGDIDGLKPINDRFGHEGGDQAIVAAAEQMRVTFRDTDIIARTGGDEFIVLALKCEEPELLKTRFEENMRAYNATGELPFPVSMSLGYVNVNLREGQTLAGFIAEADAQMYADKRAKKEALRNATTAK